MSKSTSASGLLAKVGSSFIALCIATSQAGSSAAVQEDDPTTPPPTTTTTAPTTDGNPWHG